MIPQYIILFLIAMDLGGSLYKHGEYKTGKYNFFSSLISAAIIIYILCAGGFLKGMF